MSDVDVYALGALITSSTTTRRPISLALALAGAREFFTMDKHVIEYAGEPVGIAVPENGKLKFIAVKYHVMDLDEQLFPTTAEVNAAIHRLVVHHKPSPLHS